MPVKQTEFIEESGGEFASDQETNPMAEMLDQYLSCRNLKPGQIVSGVVVHIRPSAVIVDVGAKCEGIVPERDLEELSQTELDAIHVDDEVLVYVVDPEDDNGNIMLSLFRAQIARDWLEAQRLLESQDVIEGPVIDHNKGGVIVQVGRVRGFAPVSQLAASTLPINNFLSREATSVGGLPWSVRVSNSRSLRLIRSTTG